MTDRYARAGLSGKPIDFHRVIDAHGHLGQNHDFLIVGSGADQLVPTMDRLGIDVIVVSSNPGAIGGWSKGNDLVLDAIQRYPDRIMGYITVNGHAPETVQAECRRCWDGGCRALKLHSSQGLSYDHANLKPALEFAADRRCPILVHTWVWELDHLQPLFDQYPDNTWSLAHAGCGEPERYAQVAKDHGNVVLDTAFSRSPRGLLEYFVSEGLEDRILWGSDANFMAAAHQLGRVLFANLSEGVKKKLLCDNACRVFGLSQAP